MQPVNYQNGTVMSTLKVSKNTYCQTGMKIIECLLHFMLGSQETPNAKITPLHAELGFTRVLLFFYSQNIDYLLPFSYLEHFENLTFHNFTQQQQPRKT